jgi:protein ImuB
MFAVISIPDFYLQAVLRLEPELRGSPLALLSEKTHKQSTILQCTTKAQRSGVQPGLTAVQALARCPRLIFKTFSHAAGRTATDVLLQTAYGFSPNIEMTSDGVCMIDLRGLNFGDEDQLRYWAEKIRSALAQFHLQSTIGIGQTPGLALLAAQATDEILIALRSDDFASRLPIQSLKPSPEIENILRRWGIHTIGEFIVLQREDVAERLGAVALELFERVSPTAVRPLNIIKPSESFVEEMDFEVEVETTEALLFALKRFVEQLATRISFSHRVVSELQLRLSLSSGDKYDHTFKIPSPTSSVEMLFRMLHTHLETLRADSPIISLRLEAVPCRPQLDQFGLFESALRDPNQFAETLARLAALVGAERVGTPVVENSFRPDSFRMQTPNFEATGPFEISNSQSEIGLRLRRFRSPIDAHVELRDGKPVFVNSLKLNCSVEQVSGPWRSSGDWWEREKLWDHNAWDIQASDGALYRVFQEGRNWFLEGVYD